MRTFEVAVILSFGLNVFFPMILGYIPSGATTKHFGDDPNDMNPHNPNPTPNRRVGFWRTAGQYGDHHPIVQSPCPFSQNNGIMPLSNRIDAPEPRKPCGNIPEPCNAGKSSHNNGIMPLSSSIDAPGPCRPCANAPESCNAGKSIHNNGIMPLSSSIDAPGPCKPCAKAPDAYDYIKAAKPCANARAATPFANTNIPEPDGGCPNAPKPCANTNAAKPCDNAEANQPCANNARHSCGNNNHLH